MHYITIIRMDKWERAKDDDEWAKKNLSPSEYYGLQAYEAKRKAMSKMVGTELPFNYKGGG